MNFNLDMRNKEHNLKTSIINVVVLLLKYYLSNAEGR